MTTKKQICLSKNTDLEKSLCLDGIINNDQGLDKGELEYLIIKVVAIAIPILLSIAL